MFKKLRIRFGMFDDGSRIKPISREEFAYRKSDGHSVIVYVFWVTGNEEDIDRVLVQSTINHWIEPDSKEIISITEQEEIIKKFSDYFGVSGEIMKVDKS